MVQVITKTTEYRDLITTYEIKIEEMIYRYLVLMADYYHGIEHHHS